jgi:hypothetical protein
MLGKSTVAECVISTCRVRSQTDIVAKKAANQKADPDNSGAPVRSGSSPAAIGVAKAKIPQPIAAFAADKKVRPFSFCVGVYLLALRLATNVVHEHRNAWC